MGGLRRAALKQLDVLRRARPGEITPIPDAEGPTGIVFSKDRPMQLDGLLYSLRKHAHGVGAIHVIYAASDPRYLNAYDQVRSIHDELALSFHGEAAGSEFASLLRNVLNGVESRTMYFLVDDIVMVRDIDLRAYASLARSDLIPSMRLGRNISESYMTQSSLRRPHFRPISFRDSVEGEHVLEKLGPLGAWRWSTEDGDWAYPLSVDGNVFLTSVMRTLVSQLEFSSPNTLEAEMQVKLRSFVKAWGVCRQLSAVVNLPINRVQTEFDNRFGGVHQDQLLDLWLDGYRFDVDALSGIVNKSVHQEFDVSTVRRTI